MAFWSCIFNNVDLGGLTNILITKVDIHSRPNLNIQTYKLARQPGQKLINAEYADKIINIEGYIAATDRATYESNRDNLINNIQTQEGTLQISQAGQTRLYTSTVKDLTWAENQGGFGYFTLQFYCSNPFGQDNSSTILLNASVITTTNNTKAITPISGSFNASPKITILINSLSLGTNKYIKITNPANSKFITITRTWQARDVLIINCFAKTVTVNNVTADYTGTFPVWAPGASTVKYDDTFTTRNISLTFEYTRRFL